MHFDITTANGVIQATDRSAALARGIPPADIATAIKQAAISEIARVAHHFRTLIDQATGGKLASLQIKAAIADDEAGTAPEKLAMIDREAAANGQDRTTFLAAVLATRDDIELTFLEVDAMQAEANALIVAIDGTAEDIEAQIQAVLDAKKGEAQIAFQNAITRINGGT